MENLETLAAFERGVEGFRRMYGVEPELLAADAHPAYLTRRWALERSGDVVDVQHHHAHVASVMAENGHDGATRVLGVAFDGTGFGRASDGDAQIWGGEFLLADYEGYERVGHLAPLPLPGGDEAVRNPCRVAVAYLAATGVELDPMNPAVAACDEVERNVVTRQVERDVGCIPTTSMGRLFDAVASLLGVRHRVSYEAQAAIELEALADAAVDRVALCFDVHDGVADPRPLLAALVDALGNGAPAPALALGFHQAVADMVRHVAESARGDVDTVALTGGVFQNALLTHLTRRELDAIGARVLTHRLVPPNDGGLALGQAVVAGHRRAMERT
jgi:hydrogenase maturation protein HypF